MTSSDFSRGPGFKRQPVFNSPPYVLWTCIGILICSLAFLSLGRDYENMILIRFAVDPDLILAQFADGAWEPSLSGLLPMVTHVLLHGSPLHLIVNLGFLLAFGTVVERRCGGLLMLLIFLASAVAGAALQVWWSGPLSPPLIGASGGVYGLIGATLTLAIRRRSDPRLRQLAKAIILIMILNLVFALTGIFDRLLGLQIAWEAHFGGFFAGALLGLVSGLRKPGEHKAEPPV